MFKSFLLGNNGIKVYIVSMTLKEKSASFALSLYKNSTLHFKWSNRLSCVHVEGEHKFVYNCKFDEWATNHAHIVRIAESLPRNGLARGYFHDLIFGLNRDSFPIFFAAKTTQLALKFTLFLCLWTLCKSIQSLYRKVRLKACLSD